MAQTTKEATRLVYVEGIDLSNALKMSANYPNIIFLTDDNKKSYELSSSEKDIHNYTEDTSFVNDNWDIGLNIVRGGHKYIVVRGINNEHCSFTADGTKYTLRIDQNGLLYLDANEINERFIYIGKDPINAQGEFIFDIKGIKNAIESSNVDNEANSLRISKAFVYAQTANSKNEITNYIYLAIVKDNADVPYGYIWMFSDINTLREATQYNENIGNSLIGPKSNQNIDFKSTTDIEDIRKYIDEYSENAVFGVDLNNDSQFWNNNEEIYVMLPSTYKDVILVTNTLSQKMTNNSDETNDNILDNNQLSIPFIMKYSAKSYPAEITVDYNKSKYYVYQFDYKVRTLGFTVKNS